MIRAGHIRVGLIVLLLAFSVRAKDQNQDILKKRVPLTREKKLLVNLSYGNGYLVLEKGPSRHVFESKFLYENARPDIRYDIVGDQGRLEIDFAGKMKKSDGEESHQISSLNKIFDNRLYLYLSPEVDTEMDLELGVVKGTLDFSGLRLRNLRMEIGVSEADMLFDTPNPILMEDMYIEGGVGKLRIERLGNANFRQLTFKGGIGSYEVDLSGSLEQNARVNIQLGMGKILLYLPDYVGTRIRVQKSFLSSFSVNDCYREDGYYYNTNWGKTSRQLDVRIETGVGKVKVIWVDR